MASKRAEIDTAKLLEVLDRRHEELLHDLEELNLQIEQALAQLRPAEAPLIGVAATEPVAAAPPAPQPKGKRSRGRRTSTSARG